MSTTPILDDETMRDLGFTDHVEENWYLCVRVAAMTTLNITINKQTGEWKESVIDEYFGQHAPYMDAKPEFRDEVITNVDKVMATLNEAGLTVHANHDMYSWVK